MWLAVLKVITIYSDDHLIYKMLGLSDGLPEPFCESQLLNRETGITEHEPEPPLSDEWPPS